MRILRPLPALALMLMIACGSEVKKIEQEVTNVELPPASIAESLITKIIPPDLLAGGTMKVIGIYAGDGKAWIKAYRVERNGIARENEIYDVAVKKVGDEWKVRDPFDPNLVYR